MAAIIPDTILLLFTAISLSVSVTFSTTVVEDLANLKPPQDFNNTISKNCLHNPSIRYCNHSASDLVEVFKFTIVASHLCNESRNPNCQESFSKIDLKARPKIAPLYLSYDFFWKYCPLSIMSIDLSNNSIKGSFPTQILTCTQIQSLDLSLNELTGDFPLQSFYHLTNLTFLNLSYNSFSACKVSDFQFFNKFNASSLLHSGLIPNHKDYRIKAIFLLVGFPISVILMVLCLGWLCFQRPDYLPRVFQRMHKFTPQMLKAATNSFGRKNLVVKIEGVNIYRGTLRDGTEVRIEIYKDTISREARRRFTEECAVLVQLHHKNLIRIVGWCNNRKQRAIVTEWTGMENIETWLVRSAPSWKHRLKMLVGVLEGMCYLQETWPQIGYDLRTRSLLLTHNAEPLISRFKLADLNRTRNIYKFGVFILETISNRRPLEEFETGETGFIEFIRSNYTGNLQEVIDARMKLTDHMIDQVKHGIQLGLMCTVQSVSKHPSLHQMRDMITSVLASQNHRTTHGDGSKGHNRIPSRRIDRMQIA